MLNKITHDPEPSTDFDEFSPEPPSFVRLIKPDKGLQTTDIERRQFWSPEKSGLYSIDYERGRQHCETAIDYSRSHGTASFLLCVVMAMQGRPIEAMEHGFLDVLVLRALSGAVPAKVSDAVLHDVVNADIPALRKIEAFVEWSLVTAKTRHGQSDIPELMANYVVELLGGGHGPWIGAAILILARAAMNGCLN